MTDKKICNQEPQKLLKDYHKENRFYFSEFSLRMNLLGRRFSWEGTAAQIAFLIKARILEYIILNMEDDNKNVLGLSAQFRRFLSEKKQINEK
jgi:hypothetical protein